MVTLHSNKDFDMQRKHKRKCEACPTRISPKRKNMYVPGWLTLMNEWKCPPPHYEERIQEVCKILNVKVLAEVIIDYVPWSFEGKFKRFIRIPQRIKYFLLQKSAIVLNGDGNGDGNGRGCVNYWNTMISNDPMFYKQTHENLAFPELVNYESSYFQYGNSGQYNMDSIDDDDVPYQNLEGFLARPRVLDDNASFAWYKGCIYQLRGNEMVVFSQKDLQLTNPRGTSWTHPDVDCSFVILDNCMIMVTPLLKKLNVYTLQGKLLTSIALSSFSGSHIARVALAGRYVVIIFYWMTIESEIALLDFDDNLKEVCRFRTENYPGFVSWCQGRLYCTNRGSDKVDVYE
jgi:hypothetical protein